MAAPCRAAEPNEGVARRGAPRGSPAGNMTQPFAPRPRAASTSPSRLRPARGELTAVQWLGNPGHLRDSAWAGSPPMQRES